jgi:hypothetical protein
VLIQVEEQMEQQVAATRKQIDNDKVKCNKMIVVMKSEGDKASLLYSFK